MLSAFVKNTESSSSILIQDSLDASGSSLLHAVTSLLSSRHPSVHVACLDNRPERFKTLLTISHGCSVTYHDFTRDHRGWNSGNVTPVTDLSGLDVSGKLLVIDSLSTLVSRAGFLQAYRQIHSLVRSNVTVLCLLHADCLLNSDSTAQKFRHLFATCFRVETTTDSERVSLTCRHIKKGGRVVRSKEIISVGNSNRIVFHAVEVVKDVKDFGPVKVDAIPKELTTFKIDLAPKEKEARDRLVLPYVSTGGGKVFYEPDDADDWDDEDPDEDLEI